MNKYKVCVYAICKNEESFVDRWMNAVSEADIIIVSDTGSTDNTIERLRGRGAIVYSDKTEPWRFDTARNTAMDHIPQDIDICVSNDLDEIFSPGWREKLEDAWKENTTRASYLFSYSYKADGTPDKQFTMEKIHTRNGFRWIHPVHEILKCDIPENIVWVDGLILNHYPDNSKSRGSYLPLLELSMKENPDDDRAMFWLGREYMYYKQYDKSIETLKAHLKMPTAGWLEERCASMRFIARCYKEKGNLKEARQWLYLAIAECPTIREPYYDMTLLAFDEKAWSLVLFMVTEALKITYQSVSYLREPTAWGHAFYDYGAICCYWLGLFDRAKQYAQIACDMQPDDQRLKNNLDLINLKIV